MRYSFGFMYVLAICVVSLVGCGDTNVTVYCGPGGSQGAGGSSGGDVREVFPCTEAGIRDAIAKGGGPFGFACNGQTTVVTQAELIIDNDVILDGGGNLTVDGDQAHRVFSVDEDVTAELLGFTVSRGSCVAPEGDCIGTAITNSGTLSLTNSTLSNNTGVALLNEATMTVMNSTLSNPEGAPDGVHSHGMLTIVNSTVDDMIQNYAVMTLTQSTLDRVDSQFEDSVTITNSLVAMCVDAELPKSGGHNIESPGDTCGFDQDSDLVNVDPEDLKLGPLADNGGPTNTRELEDGSVAIDGVPEADCLDANGEPLAEDQRGEPRPETGGSMCDVGAFEVQP